MANLFSDNFNRADEGLGASADWTERQGDYDVVSNQVTLTSTAGSVRCAHIASSYITTANYIVKSDVAIATFGSLYQGICGRRVNYSTNDSDMYVVIYSTANDFQLYKRISGAWTVLDTYVVTLAGSTSYKFELKMNGTTIEGYLDDVLRVNATDSSLTASGDAGLQNGTDSTAASGRLWDDFSVDSIITDSIAPFRRRIEARKAA